MNRRRLPFHLISISIAALSWVTVVPVHVRAESVQSVQSGHSVESRFSGAFEFIGGKKELASIHEAIGSATRELNKVIKRIATHRLTETTRPYQTLKLEVLGNKVRAWMGKRDPWETIVDGAWFPTKSRDGHKISVKHRMIHGGLVQTIKTRGGTRTNTFRPTADGKMVRVHVRITSGRLTDPVEFALTYRRVDPLAALMISR